MKQIQTKALFDLARTISRPHLDGTVYPWEALEKLGDFIRALGATLPSEVFDRVGEEIWVAKSATVAPSACLRGPCIIDEGAEIRHCAYIRGSVIVGKGAVVGNSCECKNCILFDGAQVPHFNYVGDSILGYRAHMGAGAVTSNVKGNGTAVVIHGERDIATGRRKLGAMLGDGVEIGCGAVLNPGVVVGRSTQVYPLISLRGVVGENCICKSADTIVQKDLC